MCQHIFSSDVHFKTQLQESHSLYSILALVGLKDTSNSPHSRMQGHLIVIGILHLCFFLLALSTNYMQLDFTVLKCRKLQTCTLSCSDILYKLEKEYFNLDLLCGHHEGSAGVFNLCVNCDL